MSAAFVRAAVRGTVLASVLGAAMTAQGAPVVAAPPTSTGAVPAMASLPVVSPVAGIPGTAVPRLIPAGEHVDGLAALPVPAGHMRARYLRPGVRQTYLFGSSTQAKDFDRSQRGVDVSLGQCLVDGGNDSSLQSRRNQEDPASREWPASYSSFLAFQFEVGATERRSVVVRNGKRARSITGGDVHAVHAERFVAGEGRGARIEMTDAWFDPRTGGARLIGRSTLWLVRVFEGPSGVDVYAAKDGDALQVVFRAGAPGVDDAALARALRERTTGITANLGDTSGNTDCGHLRTVLRAPAGGGEMATMQGTAFLPPLDDDWGTAPQGETDEARGARLLQSMRTRPYQLAVSATRSSKDAAPVVSVALGWIGREQQPSR